jgi:hypothetical protein
MQNDVFYTLVYNVNGVDLFMSVNGKYPFSADENGMVSHAKNAGGTSGSEPLNSLLKEGENVMDLKMTIPDESPDYECKIELYLAKKGEVVDTMPGGHKNGILDFSLREMVEKGKIQKNADASYSYRAAFNV